MPKLVLMSGSANQREFLLGDVAVLGRSADCHVTVTGSLISREHARITKSEDGYRLEDLQSANGTVLNGRVISAGELHDGDRIDIGDCQLVFMLEDGYAPEQGVVRLDTGMETVVEAMDVRGTLACPAGESQLRAHLDVVNQMAERACGTLEIGDLVTVCLRQLVQVYEQADCAHALLRRFGPGGQDLQLTVAREGEPPPGAAMSRTLLKIATEQGQAVRAADVGSDARLDDAVSIVGRSLRSIMCSPLMMGSRTLGAIQLDTTRGEAPFTGDDLRLLVTIAGQLAVAAENSRLHREMVEQQRLAAVGEAVANIAHCIKNTVNGLAGGMYILDLGLRDEDQGRVAQAREMITRNSAFISELVRDMLAYCRRAPLRREPTDVAALLHETAAMVQESAAQEGVDIALDVQEGLPLAEIDPTAIKRAVLNLLTNAVEACSEGGQARVRAEVPQDAGRLIVTVEDDGSGMSQEVRERLFEAFYTTKGGRGTGLGLALVHKIVQEHAGSIEVDSEPGQGASFRVSIPVEPGEEETELK
ncbi:MAG: ATP-binding protein [Planctomycetota bacterium]